MHNTRDDARLNFLNRVLSSSESRRTGPALGCVQHGECFLLGEITIAFALVSSYRHLNVNCFQNGELVVMFGVKKSGGNNSSCSSQQVLAPASNPQ